MANPILQNKRVLMAAVESTYGVDAVPTGSDAILCADLTLNPLEADVKERNNITPFLGASKSIVTGTHATLDVSVEIAPGGDANSNPVPGTEPQWSPLMKACGMVLSSYSSTASTAVGSANSTEQSVILTGASSVNDIYNGNTVTLAENGGTSQANATLNTVTLVASAGTPTAVSAVDNHYLGADLSITHFSGTKSADGAGVVSYQGSSKDMAYMTITAASLSSSVIGCLIDITVGGTTVTQKIKNFKLNNAGTAGKVSFDPVTLTLSGSVTWAIREVKPIIGYVGSTKVATLKSALKFASGAKTYAISRTATISTYIGATKTANLTASFQGGYVPATTDTYVINATSKSYAPTSAFSSMSSVTLYFYYDDVLYSIVGARGTCSLDFTTGDIPKMKFSLTGMIGADPVISAPTSVNTAAFVQPLPVNAANTTQMAIDTCPVPLVLDKISFDLGNTVTYRNLVNSETVYITNRKAKGQFTIEALRPTDFDFLNAIKTATTCQLTLAHGPEGNKVAVVGKSIQMTKYQFSDKDGIAMATIDFTMIPTGTAGNDELLIIV